MKKIVTPGYDFSNQRDRILKADEIRAVWMHVPPASRARALRKLATMLSPSGRIAISLRLSEPDKEREMY